MKFSSRFLGKSAVNHLIIWVSVITLATLVITGSGFYFYTTSTMKASHFHQERVIADEITEVLSLPLYTLDDQTAINNARVYLTSGRLSGIRLSSEASGLLFEQGMDKKSMIPPLKSMISYEGMLLGEISLVMDDSRIKAAQKNTFLIIIILTLVIFTVYAFFLKLVFRKILSENLNQILKGVSRFEHGSLEEKIRSLPYEDLNQLVTGLNSMAGSIISKQQRIEEEEQDLQNLKNYLANIIDSMPSVLIGVDKDSRITQWNAVAEKNSGLTAEAALGQPLEKVFPGFESYLKKIDEAIRTGQVLQEKKRIIETDDIKKYEDITLYPLAAEGAEGVVIRIDDVTEQVRLEEMMIQSEKMVSVGGLAAGMAHEINNPLAVIMQAASVLQNRLSKTSMPANMEAAGKIGISVEDIQAYMESRGILRMVETIGSAGERAARIVENMLSFSRKSASEYALHDPRELMDKILEIAETDYDLKKEYDFKNIEIIKKYEENLPQINCEGPEIQQVLLNIIRNGVQAMNADSSNTKKADPSRFVIEIKSEPANSIVRFEISDNGPGMPEKVRKRVFEPFFTTKPPGIGTGLGLSVSYFIITVNHGGSMDVISSPGRGTTFLIRLPVHK